MNNTQSAYLARILSSKHPHLNPTADCSCYKMENASHYDFIAYGLGWWMGQAETKQDEINELKAELARIKAEKVS